MSYLIAYRFMLLHRALLGEDRPDGYHLEYTVQGINACAAELPTKRVTLGLWAWIEMLTYTFEWRLGIR